MRPRRRHARPYAPLRAWLLGGLLGLSATSGARAALALARPVQDPAPAAAPEDDARARRLAFLERRPYHDEAFEQLLSDVRSQAELEELAAGFHGREDEAGLVLHARLLARLGSHRRALTVVERAPARAEREHLRGRWLARLGSLTQAAEVLAAARTDDPRLARELARARVDVLARIDRADLLEAYDDLLALDPDDPAPAEEAVAELLALGHDGAARRLLPELDRRAGTDPEARVRALALRAEVAAARGEPWAERAVWLELRGLLSADHWRRPEVDARLLELFRAAGRTNEWLGVLEVDLRADPGDPGRWVAHAEGLRAAGRADEAQRVLRDAHARFPDDDGVLRARLDLLRRFGRHETRARELQAAVAGGRLGVEGRLALGEAWLGAGQVDRARETFAPLLDPGPTGDVEVPLDRVERVAHAWAQAGRPEVAAEVRQAALDRAPTDRDLRTTCVRAWLAAGDPGRARAVLDAGLAALDPEHPAGPDDPWPWAVDRLLELGEVERARALARESWERDPGFERGVRWLELRPAPQDEEGRIAARPGAWAVLRAAGDLAQRRRGVELRMGQLVPEGTRPWERRRSLEREYLALEQEDLRAPDPLLDLRLALEEALDLSLPAQGTRLALLAAQPERTDLLEAVARAHARLGERDRAMAAWAELARVAPERAFLAGLEQARLQRRAGLEWAARERLLALRPEALRNDASTLELADLYRSLDDPASAWALLRDASRLRPDSGVVALELVRASLGLREPEVAFRAARRAWAVGDADTREDAVRRLATSLGSFEDLDEVVRRFALELAGGPGEVRDHLLLVALYAATGDTEAHREALDRLLAAHPRHPRALELGARAFAEGGRFLAAASCADRLRRIEGDPDGAWLLRCVEWYGGAGRHGRARARVRELAQRVDSPLLGARAAARGGATELALEILGVADVAELDDATLRTLAAEQVEGVDAAGRLLVQGECCRRFGPVLPWIRGLALATIDDGVARGDLSGAVDVCARWSQAAGAEVVSQALNHTKPGRIMRNGHHHLRRAVLVRRLAWEGGTAAGLETAVERVWADCSENARAAAAQVLVRLRDDTLAGRPEGVPDAERPTPERLLELELLFAEDSETFLTHRWEVLEQELLAPFGGTPERSYWTLREAVTLLDRMEDPSVVRPRAWGALLKRLDAFSTRSGSGVPEPAPEPGAVRMLEQAIASAVARRDLEAALSWARWLQRAHAAGTVRPERALERPHALERHERAWAALPMVMLKRGGAGRLPARRSFVPAGAGVGNSGFGVDDLAAEADGLDLLVPFLELALADVPPPPVGPVDAWVRDVLADDLPVWQALALAEACEHVGCWRAAGEIEAWIEDALPWSSRSYAEALAVLAKARQVHGNFRVLRLRQQVATPEGYLVARLALGRDAILHDWDVRWAAYGERDELLRTHWARHEEAVRELEAAREAGEAEAVTEAERRVHRLGVVLAELTLWAEPVKGWGGLETLAKADPDPRELWRWTALALERAGEPARAEVAWQRVLDAPDGPPSLSAGGDPPLRLGPPSALEPRMHQKTWGPAVDARGFLVGRELPDEPEALGDRLCLALLLVEEGRPVEARRALAAVDPAARELGEDVRLSPDLLERLDLVPASGDEPAPWLWAQLRALEPTWLPVLTALAGARRSERQEGGLDRAWLDELRVRLDPDSPADRMRLEAAEALFR